MLTGGIKAIRGPFTATQFLDTYSNSILEFLVFFFRLTTSSLIKMKCF